MTYKLEHSNRFSCDGSYYRFADHFLIDDKGDYAWVDSWVERQSDDKWIKLGPNESQDVIDLYWQIGWGTDN